MQLFLGPDSERLRTGELENEESNAAYGRKMVSEKLPWPMNGGVWLLNVFESRHVPNTIITSMI